MHDIILRKATLYDLDLLQQIGRQTFSETFAAVNTAENMANYLETGFSRTKLESELNNPSCEFYFAVLEDSVIGYLKTNTGAAQTELQDERALEIERIYVLKEFHGTAAGKLLLGQALRTAKAHGAPYVWLGVWEENPRAIRFYSKNGFVPFGRHIFRLGDDQQTDLLMKLSLAEISR